MLYFKSIIVMKNLWLPVIGCIMQCYKVLYLCVREIWTKIVHNIRLISKQTLTVCLSLFQSWYLGNWVNCGGKVNVMAVLSWTKGNDAVKILPEEKYIQLCRTMTCGHTYIKIYKVMYWYICIYQEVTAWMKMDTAFTQPFCSQKINYTVWHSSVLTNGKSK